MAIFDNDLLGASKSSMRIDRNVNENDRTERTAHLE